MKVRVTAAYYGSQDLVQVAALLLADDGATSLHRQLKRATVSLLRSDTEMLRKDLQIEDYNEGEEGYFVFFMRPKVQNHLYVVFDVELLDGRTARVKDAVDMRQHTAQHAADNPIIPLRPTKDFTNKWDGEGKERSPL